MELKKLLELHNRIDRQLEQMKSIMGKPHNRCRPAGERVTSQARVSPQCPMQVVVLRLMVAETIVR
jgi:hypothetical protein